MRSLRHDYFIKAAIEQNASDIHIAPNAKPMLRVNGVLHVFEDSEILTHEDVDEGVKTLCDEYQLELLNRTGELNFSFSIPDHGRFRVNIVKQRGTYSISIRILKLLIPSKETLGLPSVLFEMASQKRKDEKATDEISCPKCRFNPIQLSDNYCKNCGDKLF